MNVVISIMSLIKNTDKFYSQLFLEGAFYDE